MIITKTVSFFLPEEHEEEKEFREEHGEWTVAESTGMRTYTKTVIERVNTENEDRYD